MIRCAVIAALCFALFRTSSHAIEPENSRIGSAVARPIRPLMQRYGIPGISVGIIVDGRSYIYDYGVASKATQRPVTRATLFEIGSLSKTLTASLASYAHVTGKLSASRSCP